MLREYLHVPGMGETTGARRFATSWRCASARARPGSACPEFVHAGQPRGDRRVDRRGWRRRGCSSRDRRPRRSASGRSASADGAVARSSTRSATRGRITCSSSSCRATSTTSTRWCSIAAIVFAAASRYGTPPMAVAHEGGIFVTRDAAGRGSRPRHGCKAMNARRARVVRPAARRRRTPSSSARTTAAVFSRDLGPRRRRLHRRRRRGGDRRQSVARVGEDRDRRRARRLRAAAVAGRVRRDRAVAGAAGGAGPERLRRSGDRDARREAPSCRADRVGRRRAARADADGVVRGAVLSGTSTRPPRRPSAPPTDSRADLFCRQELRPRSTREDSRVARQFSGVRSHRIAGGMRPPQDIGPRNVGVCAM